MNIKPNSRLRVIADYEAPNPDPIRVKAGETVTVDAGKMTGIPGWVWCTSRAGKSGWTPEVCLERQGDTTRMRCDYDAVELTIRVGDVLVVHKVESGFYWVTDRNRRQGWVPADHVEPVQTGKGAAK
jgi:uncharacterized protein YgiM (DUF1202 family)